MSEITQGNFIQLKEIWFQIERSHFVPSTMDENRFIPKHFSGTSEHQEQRTWKLPESGWGPREGYYLNNRVI